MHVHILKGANITVGLISQIVHGFLMQKELDCQAVEPIDLLLCDFFYCFSAQKVLPSPEISSIFAFIFFQSFEGSLFYS